LAALDWLVRRPIAHRGYHDRAAGRVENTLAAARAAIAHDFAIECDLQVTVDGHAVVFHDDHLERLTDGHGPIRALDLAGVRRLTLRDAGEPVPTLAELLEVTAGRVPLVIEMKSPWNGDRSLEKAAAPLLAGYEGPVAVMSFDPDSMRAMRRLLPTMPRGLTADAFRPDPEMPPFNAWQRFRLANLLAAPAVGASFVSYGISDLPALAPALARRLGLRLITWTIRTPADLAKAGRYTEQITFEGFDPDRPPAPG
jgi:glycerophosphoryl diester phosphodiesterase